MVLCSKTIVTMLWHILILMQLKLKVEEIIGHIRGDGIIVGHSYQSVRVYPSSVPLSRHPAHLRPLSSW